MRKFILSIVAVVAIYGALSLVPASDAPPHQIDLFSADRLMVIGHRGGSELGPENTMLAFSRAAEAGADMLELDLHLSLDGTLVINHDAMVDRTSDGTGAISRMGINELKQLDLGEGQHIVTLEELFQAFPQMYFNVELKSDQLIASETACRVIHNNGMQRNVLVASFHHHILEHFRTTCAGVTTSLSEKEVRWFIYLSKIGLENLLPIHGSALQVPMTAEGWEIITTDLVSKAHARGLAVHAWTINDPLQMQKVKLLGVDGLITDYPARAITVMRGLTADN